MTVVPKERFELSHPLGRGILNPLRLPFRHLGPESLLLCNIANEQTARDEIPKFARKVKKDNAVLR